MKIYSMEAYRL